MLLSTILPWLLQTWCHVAFQWYHMGAIMFPFTHHLTIWSRFCSAGHHSNSGGFSSQRASNSESISMSWCHHVGGLSQTAEVFLYWCLIHGSSWSSFIKVGPCDTVNSLATCRSIQHNIWFRSTTNTQEKFDFKLADDTPYPLQRWKFENIFWWLGKNDCNKHHYSNIT